MLDCDTDEDDVEEDGGDREEGPANPPPVSSGHKLKERYGVAQTQKKNVTLNERGTGCNTSSKKECYTK